MVRLIVEEDGAHRAFRLGEGSLSVGSEEGQGLHLTAQGVAPHHLDLALVGGRVQVRPVAGAPLKSRGLPLEAPTELDWNQPLEIGAVRIWVDEGSGPVKPPPRGSVAPRMASTGEREERRRQAIAQATGQTSRSKVSSRRRATKKGMPGWAIALLFLVGAGAVVGVLQFGLKGSAVAGEIEITSRIGAARDLLRNSAFDGAQRQLDFLSGNAGLSPEQQAEIQELQLGIDAALAQAGSDKEMRVGENYLNIYLKRYEKNHLQGRPQPAHVRLFMQRVQDFRARWPKHPEMDWVRRQESRFAGVVDLSAPPTFADAEWEISRLVLTSPREYRKSFARLDELEDRALEDESISAHLEEIAALRAKLAVERKVYHVDRLQQAKFEFEEKDNPASAVWWLLHSVIWLGDPALEDEAAEILVKFPELDQHLRGYADKYPDKYAAVIANEIVRRYAKKHDLPDA